MFPLSKIALLLSEGEMLGVMAHRGVPGQEAFLKLRAERHRPKSHSAGRPPLSDVKKRSVAKASQGGPWDPVIQGQCP